MIRQCHSEHLCEVSAIVHLMKALRSTLLAATLLLTLGASVSHASAESPASGEIVPDFTLTDHQGKRVHLAEEAAESTTVLVFYRGYW